MNFKCEECGKENKVSVLIRKGKNNKIVELCTTCYNNLLVKELEKYDVLL